MSFLSVLAALAGTGIALGAATGGCVFAAGRPGPRPSQPYLLVLGTGEPALSERIEAAYAYLTAHPDTQAVLTGGMGEARRMYQALTARGICPDRLWTEDQSLSTWDNLRFSLEEICRRTGRRPKELAVVTSDFHMCRVHLHALFQGLRVVPSPARTASRLRYLHGSFREICGIWHFFLLPRTYPGRGKRPS